MSADDWWADDTPVYYCPVCSHPDHEHDSEGCTHGGRRTPLGTLEPTSTSCDCEETA
jgi:hypothetical protein